MSIRTVAGLLPINFAMAICLTSIIPDLELQKDNASQLKFIAEESLRELVDAGKLGDLAQMAQKSTPLPISFDNEITHEFQQYQIDLQQITTSVTTAGVELCIKYEIGKLPDVRKLHFLNSELCAVTQSAKEMFPDVPTKPETGTKKPSGLNL